MQRGVISRLFLGLQEKLLAETGWSFDFCVSLILVLDQRIFKDVASVDDIRSKSQQHFIFNNSSDQSSAK